MASQLVDMGIDWYTVDCCVLYRNMIRFSNLIKTYDQAMLYSTVVLGINYIKGKSDSL